ncbi:V-type proton ATPase subunit C 1-B [Dissostichus eleginoides]|uniref:V-type proton ATPase subunit C n=1 Tax=Dissostichus eleginoides TaxID=100907 RepID=A0AAD9C464_DISEL|nr:V-type proton ATPase subunit C 1-B [Dissostichus eleginoides]
MTDFWLISVPLDKTSLTSVEKLKRNLAKTNLVSCCRFSIPELKVGILDSLLSVSDDLSKLDTLTESVIKKTHQCMREVMEQSDDKVLENALANGADHSMNQTAAVSPLKAYLNSLRVDLMSYMTKFQWDKAKYPTALPLSSLADIITKEVSQMETELKSRAAAYSSVKTSLQSMEYKLHGSLQTCSLNDIVRKEDLVTSEHLTTLLVVRELLAFVVPRSSRKLYEDGEGGVFSLHSSKELWVNSKPKPRRASSPSAKGTIRNLCALAEGEFQPGVIAWIHLKALRVFAESVLRYGLPVNYQALLLHTDKKRSKKLREDLASLFKHLDPTASNSKTDVSFDIPGLCQPEYLSYICFYINTNLLELS